MNAHTIASTSNNKFGLVEYLFWGFMALTALADFGVGYAVGFYAFDVIYFFPFAVQAARFVSNHVVDEAIPHMEAMGRVIDVLTAICGAILPVATIISVIYLATQGMFEVGYLMSPIFLSIKFVAMIWLIRSYWSRH